MSFQYTSGDPTHLTGGANASMADIQGPFTDLRTFLNARIAAIPTLVSSLPVSPVDGQEIYYLVDSTNGVVWHLRYRAASASTYKWEFVGGTDLFSQVATLETTASTTYVALTTPGPAVALPLAGDYNITLGMTARVAGDSVMRMSYDIGGTGAVDADALEVRSDSTARYSASMREAKKTGLSAVTLTAKYASSGGTASFYFRSMRARPVRVG